MYYNIIVATIYIPVSIYSVFFKSQFIKSKMSVKFTKLQETELCLKDSERGDDEINLQVIVSVPPSSVSDTESEGAVLFAEENGANTIAIKTPKWKFWASRHRYRLTRQLSHKSSRCKRYVCKVNSWKAVVIALLLFSAAVLISVVISRLATEPPDTPEQQENNGAVITDAPICTQMSSEIINSNGSAVDAAITALLCLGVVHPESSGLGGGGFMVVRHENGSVYSINFREAAPGGATPDMFHSNSTLSEVGGLSVAVPGELKGMELAHSLFGRLAWRNLFQPVITMCKTGFNMSVHTERALNSTWDKLHGNAQFRSIYLREDGSLKRSGDLIVRPDLAATLEMIAANGADIFYKGSIAQSIVRTVSSSEERGILTLEDLADYKALLQKPLQVDYNGHTIYAPPSPAGGPLLLFILNVMDEYKIEASSPKEELLKLNLTYHRLVEAFKYGFALRTRLGDPYCTHCGDIADDVIAVQNNMTREQYASKVRESISDDHTYNVSHYQAHYTLAEDSGTTHVSAVSTNGQAVSITSSVNTYFGSTLITDTGIILNNEMDDFSSPNITNAYGLRPSEANYIRPGKKPLSSTCPTIVVQPLSELSNQTKTLLVIGASGGTRIPTAVAQAALRFLSLSESVSDAVEATRVHHQLLPNEVCPEPGFSSAIIEFLSSRGHVIHCDSPGSYAAVQAVAVTEDGKVTVHSDTRKLGHVFVVG